MTQTAVAHPAQHDFDFLHGSWHILNRRLLRRLEGCQDWEEFEAAAEVRPMLGGLSNVDEALLPDGTPLGMTLRSLNLQTGQWHLHWVSPSDGVVQPAMIGTFVDGVGTFYADDEWQGRPCRCRFLWRVLDADHANWEQALSLKSPGEEQSWETNWTMAFTRRPLA